MAVSLCCLSVWCFPFFVVVVFGGLQTCMVVVFICLFFFLYFYMVSPPVLFFFSFFGKVQTCMVVTSYVCTFLFLYGFFFPSLFVSSFLVCYVPVNGGHSIALRDKQHTHLLDPMSPWSGNVSMKKAIKEMYCFSSDLIWST